MYTFDVLESVNRWWDSDTCPGQFVFTRTPTLLSNRDGGCVDIGTRLVSRSGSESEVQTVYL